ncbi:MAG: arylesterase [Nitrospinae bacterium]|nr:arylesterase [Nitrospinota bacterium]
MAHLLPLQPRHSPTVCWPRGRTWILWLWLILVFGGCDSEIPSLSSPNSAPVSGSATSTSQTNIKSDYPRIVAFGNSLTAGLGVSPDQSYPAQLQQRLNKAGYHYEVINAGVSGDTTAGGLRRVNWVLKSRPFIVIVELGVNDAMRGQPLAGMYSNLDEMIQQLQEAETLVVLAGMKIPPNYGLDYTRGFSSMFEQLAREHEITLIPFLLEGVAAQPELNQADGIHPTAPGYHMVADTVMTAIKPLLRKGGSL